MTEEPTRPQRSPHILTQIREGMTVEDQNGAEIGVVEMVHLGTVGEDEPDRRAELSDTIDPVQPVATSVADTPGEDMMEGRGGRFLGSDEALPPDQRRQMLREGFVRVSAAGDSETDRYVTAEQIAAVTDDIVRLHVAHEKLSKPNT